MMPIDVSYPHPDVNKALSDIEKIHLELVDGQDLVEADVYLDGRHFRNCRFDHCRIFVKVGRFIIEDPRAIKNCSFELDGPAAAMKALIDLVYQQQPGRP
jgi:hypothetical protein